MLETKLKHEKIASYEQRKQGVLEFLKQVAPKLKVVVSPLVDIYGPSVVEQDIDAIIVSLETLAGAKMINQVREKKGLNPLIVPVDTFSVRHSFVITKSCRYNSLC